MKWPCGRYNGRRIVGIRLLLRIDVRGGTGGRESAGMRERWRGCA